VCGLQSGAAAAQGLGTEQAPDGAGALVRPITAPGPLVGSNPGLDGATDQSGSLLAPAEPQAAATSSARGNRGFFNGLLSLGFLTPARWGGSPIPRVIWRSSPGWISNSPAGFPLSSRKLPITNCA